MKHNYTVNLQRLLDKKESVQVSSTNLTNNLHHSLKSNSTEFLGRKLPNTANRNSNKNDYNQTRVVQGLSKLDIHRGSGILEKIGT